MYHLQSTLEFVIKAYTERKLSFSPTISSSIASKTTHVSLYACKLSAAFKAMTWRDSKASHLGTFYQLGRHLPFLGTEYQENFVNVIIIYQHYKYCNSTSFLHRNWTWHQHLYRILLVHLQAAHRGHQPFFPWQPSCGYNCSACTCVGN